MNTCCDVNKPVVQMREKNSTSIRRRKESTKIPRTCRLFPRPRSGEGSNLWNLNQESRALISCRYVMVTNSNLNTNASIGLKLFPEQSLAKNTQTLHTISFLFQTDPDVALINTSAQTLLTGMKKILVLVWFCKKTRARRHCSFTVHFISPEEPLKDFSPHSALSTEP